MTKPRLTFREKVSVCWQKQLRDKYLHEPAPNVDLSVSSAVVRKVTRPIAKQIILKYEWLGTLPYSCTHYYGLFFGMYCAGVTCVSVGGGGANVYAYKEFGLRNQKELGYLQRGANVHWSPKNANSKLVAGTAKLLAQETNVKLLIAYSDTDAGEIGTIYQACNWICVGRGSSTLQFVSPDGRIYDQKLASNMGKKYGRPRKVMVKYLLDNGFRQQQSNPKYRYVYILDKRDKRLRKLVESKRTAYPKRGHRVNGDHLTTSQAAGSIPDVRSLETTDELPEYKED